MYALKIVQITYLSSTVDAILISRINPKWNTRLSLHKVAIAKYVWKMQKKSGIMKSGLKAMPLFLLDDLLSSRYLTLMIRVT